MDKASRWRPERAVMIEASLAATTLIAPSAIIGAGVIDDLRSRKFHNWLFVGCSVFAFAIVLTAGGWHALLPAVVGFTAGIMVILPLVLLGAIGAGDMKLFAAFGILTGWTTVLNVLVFSLIWGAVFGILRAILDGKGRELLQNLVCILTGKKRENLELNRMPFTVAILFGWLTYLVLQRTL